jgi:hypothetical protein
MSIDEIVERLIEADFVLMDRDQFHNLTGSWHYATEAEIRAALEVAP